MIIFSQELFSRILDKNHGRAYTIASPVVIITRTLLCLLYIVRVLFYLATFVLS